MSATIDGKTGIAVSEEVEGVSMPVNYSFAAVNNFVHSNGTHFEELQCLCLGMADEIERLNKIISLGKEG